MRNTIIIALSLVGVAFLAPNAAAECYWTDPIVAGVDVDYCVSDESGRPTMLMVKHKDLGGASVSDTESDPWGQSWRFTDVIVWTYWRTPVVGQSATWITVYCLDYEPDGNCDWFAAGGNTWGLGVGAGVFLRYTEYDGWGICLGNVVNCVQSPVQPTDHMPAPPYLP